MLKTMARLAQTLGLTDIQTDIVANVRRFVDTQIIPNAQELEHADATPRRSSPACGRWDCSG